MEVSQELARRRRSRRVVAGCGALLVALVLFAIDTGTGGRRHADRFLRHPAVHRGGRGGTPRDGRSPSLACVVLALLAGIADGFFGSFQHLFRVGLGALAGLLAIRVAVMRERAELVTRLDRDVGRVLAESRDVTEATPRLLEIVARELGWDAAALWEVEGRDSTLARVHAWQRPGSPLMPPGSEPRLRRRLGLPGRVLASGEPAWVADVQRGPWLCRLGRRRSGRHPCSGRLPDHGHTRRAWCDRAALPAPTPARHLADTGNDEHRPVHRPAHGAPARGGGRAPRRGGARSRARVRHRLRDHDEPRGTRGRVQPRGRANVRVPALRCGGQARTRADRAARPARRPPAWARALPRHRRGTRWSEAAPRSRR